MSEHSPEIQYNTVSRNTYEDGLETRADAQTLTDRWIVCRGDEIHNRLIFPRRLLTHSGLESDYAADDFVKVAGVDKLTDEEGGPILLSARQMLEDGTAGPLEVMTVSADGIILNDNENTPNFELGYIVGVSGVDDAEYQSAFAMIPVPPKHLQAEALPEGMEFIPAWRSYEERQNDRRI